jgi:hypothetical protein
LICLTLSSDITLFEKIAPSAYRLRVDPQIKGKEDARSDSEDSGSVDDDDDASSSDDEFSGSQKMNLPEHDKRIARRKERKNAHGSPNKCSEIDESYTCERWLLGLMEGEYSDLSIDEKLDCLAALIDIVSGAGSVPRLEVIFSNYSSTSQLHCAIVVLDKVALIFRINLKCPNTRD